MITLKKILDIPLLLFTALAALISFFVGEMLLKAFCESIDNIALMGIYFCAVGSIIVLFTNICAYKLSPIAKMLPAPNAFKKSALLFGFLVALLLFLFGCLFQFLYSFDKKESKSSNLNYIVAIDNSGSMLNTDPLFKRYTALKQLFESMASNKKGKKQNLGVYVFTDGNEKVFSMQEITSNHVNQFDSIFSQHMVSNGGTNIMKVLEAIAEDPDLTENTNIVLISDGESPVYDDTLEKLKEKSIRVDTVGVFEAEPDNALRKISTETGGTYFNIDKIEQLTGVLNNITTLKMEDRLLTARRLDLENSVNYIVMHLAFIFLLALIIKIIQALIMDIKSVRAALFSQALCFSLISSLLMEALFLKTELSESVVRCIVIAFISLLVLLIGKEQTNIINFGSASSINSASFGFNREYVNKGKQKVLK